MISGSGVFFWGGTPAKHLALVAGAPGADGAESVHCGHARGQGPCAAPAPTPAAEDQKAAGSALALSLPALAGAIALLLVV